MWRRLSIGDRWAQAYVPLGGLLVAFVVGYVVNGRRSGDVYWHVSVIERFADDPWSPANPMIGTDDPDSGFSPYLLILGLVARVTGLSGYAVLDVAGVVLVVLFVLLFRPAVEVLTGRREAAPIALLLTLVAWGIGPWRFSGYLSLNSIGFMTGYPSMAAWCALFAMVVVVAREGVAWGSGLAMGLLLAFIALSHPITLIGAGPLAVALLLRRRTRAVTVGAIAVVVVGVAIVAWPYASVFDLLGSGSAGYDTLNLLTYRRVLIRTFLAAPAIVALLWWVRRGPLDPLALMGGVAACAFVAGDLTGRWTVGRALPFLLFAAHVALAAWVVEHVSDGSARAWSVRALAAVGGVIVAVGVAGSVSGVVAAVPRALLPGDLRDDARLASEMDRFRGFQPMLGPGDVVATIDLYSTRGVPSLGASTVWPGYPAPYIDDPDERRNAAGRFLLGTSHERAAVVQQYGVTHALVPVGFGEVQGLELVASDDELRLYAVP